MEDAPPRQENFELDLDSMVKQQQREDMLPAPRSAHVQPPPQPKCDWVGVAFRLTLAAFFVLLVVGCVLGYGAAVSTEQNKADIRRLQVQIIRMSTYLNMSFGDL